MVTTGNPPVEMRIQGCIIKDVLLQFLAEKRIQEMTAVDLRLPSLLSCLINPKQSTDIGR
jgi:hypothetical protein